MSDVFYVVMMEDGQNMAGIKGIQYSRVSIRRVTYSIFFLPLAAQAPALTVCHSI